MESEIKMDDTLNELLLSDRILKRTNPRDLARILIRVERLSVGQGETLFREGDFSDKVYLIRNGEFEIARREDGTIVKQCGYLGEEAVLGAMNYKDSAKAISEGEVVVFPANALRTIAESNEVREMFFESYANRYNEEDDASETSDEPEVAYQKEKAVNSKEIVGWLATFVAPLLVYYITVNLNLNPNAVYFLAIITASVSMWIFDLVPAFIPPLFAVLMVVLFDVAPVEMAVSGFSSGTFFMLLSIFSIGAMMVISGLTYRLSLLILNIVPSGPFWYNASLFASGLLLTPVVPSQTGRTIIVSPFLADLISASGEEPKSPLHTLFVNSTIGGVSLMASIFLTGKPSNLIVFGLFDYQTQFAFQWLQWLYAALFTGFLILAMFFVITYFGVRKNKKEFSIPRKIISQQLKMLGPLSQLEWGAIAAISILIFGILFTAVHKVEIPWMATAILVALLIFGGIGKEELRSRIDWTTLIFIAAIIAWVPIMSMTGLDSLVTKNLGWLGVYMKTSLPLFIAVLCLSIILVRFVLPEVITVIVFVTALIPLANSAGVSPWVIGFIILTVAEGYIFTYQMPYSVQLKEDLTIHKFGDAYNERTLVAYNAAMILVRIIAIYASLPFWRYIEII